MSLGIIFIKIIGFFVVAWLVSGLVSSWIWTNNPLSPEDECIDTIKKIIKNETNNRGI